MQNWNILLITADDMEGSTPGAFGGHPDATPRLDQLATEGKVFTSAHVAVAVCQPSRSAVMTGMWPHRNGAEGFEPVHDQIPLLTELLSGGGYRTAIFGKVNHLQPVARFGWDTVVEMKQLGLGRDPQRYAESFASFLEDSAPAPWFAMVNAHDPHRPFHGAADVEAMFGESAEAIPEPSRVFRADDAGPVPGYLPELPEVRTEYAQYLSSARRCDDVVRAVLDELDAAGHADSTLVIFLSDNGMAFPFSKANCYLQSTHTPLIVRWPGVVEPGSKWDGPTSMLDLFPTICDAAGVAQGTVDGNSLVPILSGRQDGPGEETIVTVFHETAAKRRYEMRCVHTRSFGYIWNGWADGSEEYVAENMLGLTWRAMQARAESDDTVRQRVDFYRTRAVHELYDFVNDPNCLKNLADDPAHSGSLRTCQSELLTWMARTEDPMLSRFEADMLERSVV